MKEAAVVAAIGALLFGSALHGLALKCTGALAEILGGADGRQALLPMLRHSLLHPLDLLPFALPLFLGMLSLLLAVPGLRHRPFLAVSLGIFPFPAMIALLFLMAPRICERGPGAAMAGLLAAGLFASIAAVIVLVTRRRS